MIQAFCERLKKCCIIFVLQILQYICSGDSLIFWCINRVREGERERYIEAMEAIDGDSFLIFLFPCKNSS